MTYFTSNTNPIPHPTLPPHWIVRQNPEGSRLGKSDAFSWKPPRINLHHILPWSCGVCNLWPISGKHRVHTIHLFFTVPLIKSSFIFYSSSLNLYFYWMYPEIYTATLLFKMRISSVIVGDPGAKSGSPRETLWPWRSASKEWGERAHFTLSNGLTDCYCTLYIEVFCYWCCPRILLSVINSAAARTTKLNYILIA